MDTLSCLEYLRQHFGQMGIPCYLEPAGKDNPFPLLLFPIRELMESYPEEAASMVMFFAQPEAGGCRELKLQLLHITAYLGQVEEERVRDELRRYFAHINSQLPVGSFAVDGKGTLYYGYNLPVPEKEDTLRFLQQAAGAYALMRSALSMFLLRAMEVKTGKTTAEQAINFLRQDVARAEALLQAALKGEQQDGNV